MKTKILIITISFIFLLILYSSKAEAAQVAGTMYIDAPTYNKTYTRSDETQIKVEGWAVSNDSQAKVRLLVDGNLITENITRTKRPDVDVAISPAYGGVQFTSNAGFSHVLDISNWQTGNHKIRVQEVSR